MRYHLTAVEWLSNKSTDSNVAEDGEQRTIGHWRWEGRVVQPLWKAIWSYLKKLKMKMLYDPVISLLGTYPKKPGTLIQKNICISMFIAALFAITKPWKQLKCPSVAERIK